MKTVPYILPLIILTAGLLTACAPGGGGREAPSGQPSANPAGSPGGAPVAGGNGSGRRSAEILIQAVEAAKGTLISENSTAGTVSAYTQSQVAAQTAGAVAKVYYRAGGFVAKGQVVVQLDDTQALLTLKNSQAALENAKINLNTAQDTTSQNDPKLKLQVTSAESALAAAKKSYASAQSLYKLGGMSGSDLDTSKSQLDTAQANYEAAKIALDQNKKADIQNLAQLKLAIDQATLQVQQAQLTVDNMKIKAPFSGQISVMNVEMGQWVTTGGVAFTLVSPEKQVNFNVPPSDATRMRLGTVLDFDLYAQTYKVAIAQVPSAPVNGLVPLTASISGANLPNYGAVGTIHYRLPVVNGVIVPITALQSKEDQSYVFTIQNNKAVASNVTILGETGAHVAVQGLNLPAVVIINAPPGLLPGSTVKIANSPTGAQGVPDKQTGSDIELEGAAAVPGTAKDKPGSPDAQGQNRPRGQGGKP